MKIKSIEKSSPTPSIYDHYGQTIVCFGSGSIQVGVTTDDQGQTMIHLSDTLKEVIEEALKKAKYYLTEED